MSERKVDQADPEGDSASEAECLVDIGLIDEILRLSPEERLLQNDRMIGIIMELRDAFRTT